MWVVGGFCGYGGSVWVMGEWAVGQWIVGVTSFQKIFGLCGLKCHIVDMECGGQGVWWTVCVVDSECFGHRVWWTVFLLDRVWWIGIVVDRSVVDRECGGQCV